MNIIIRKAKIVDTSSSFHNQVVDIQIKDGSIQKIGTALPADATFKEVELTDVNVSVGWFDTSVCLGEPGFEERETIANGLQTAAQSGFTGIALQPNTYPVLDNQSAIQFVKNQGSTTATQLFPIGALTKKSEGKDMAEFFDMKKAGAVAFGDYNHAIANPMVLKIALQYAQDLDALVIAYSQDASITGHGVVREGEVSTYLGIKGIPAMAEELHISRNLFLLAYTGGKLHIPTISTQKSVALIKEAKAKGLQVTCSVAVHHLVLTDEVLKGFDTRYKVTPPLGNESDRQALLAGVKDGTIDSITSDHNPIDIELKKMEFDGAAYGTIGLESAYIALQNILSTDLIVDKFTNGRNILNLPKVTIKEGEPANLTLFTTQGQGVFDKTQIKSKSKNSAFLGVATKGKVYGIYNNKQLILNS